ncbi:serine hydrolase domain-containing protein [Fodinibius halophilus]|uniref:serine hydrolase domain-containing protein n=1 Tax=Fodinibius halophilus TaxID=1736908 RepID=UPI00197A97AA|nr:serine hydrolase domain-containing protein [Fodinibius halophilus]
MKAETNESELDDKIRKLLAEQKLTGIVWSGYSHDGPIMGAAGMANIANGIEMSVDTKVNVGSVTKTVLALGVLRLISEGRLALDANVEKLLPALNWQNSWGGATPIRVQHLLEHTAGLDNIRMWQFLNTKVTPDTPLSDAFTSSHDELLQVRTKPGNQYSYSNMGYTLLGMIIETVTKQPYEDYLKQSLLGPLGMNNSSFHFITQAEDPRLAMGYLEQGVPQPSVPIYLRPAGQFTTTAPDMLRLLEFMLGNGTINQRHFISPELMAMLGKPSSTKAFKEGLDIGHGLALASRDRHGVLSYCHPGTTFGFRAYLCLYPEEDKAFFYAINTDNEKADYERFNQLFIEQLEVKPVKQVKTTSVPKDLSDYTGLYVLSPNNMAQFAWLDWMFNSIWLSEQNGYLVIRSLQQPERRLEAINTTLFRDTNRQLASHIFITNEEGIKLSNGLKTYQKASPFLLLINWVGLILGLLGLVYILLRGTWLVLHRKRTIPTALLLPYLNIVLFAVPAYLYFHQHFLEFGNKTAASISLATFTGMIPIVLLISIVLMIKNKPANKFDYLGLGALLQLCLVLVYWDVLPMIFWS